MLVLEKAQNINIRFNEHKMPFKINELKYIASGKGIIQYTDRMREKKF